MVTLFWLTVGAIIGAIAGYFVFSYIPKKRREKDDYNYWVKGRGMH